MSEYSEKLKDPRWQKKRLEIMQRDNFTCRLCGDAESELNVHHLYYVSGKAVYEYDNESLVTLCHDCHKSSHNEISKISSLIAFQVICNGMSYFDVCNLLKIKL